ncbi:MAG: hypothetical protein FJZ58_04180 [Chlamydiae bacterium]|nr:hypothetical protein [Chlamydiota bacterium]
MKASALLEEMDPLFPGDFFQVRCTLEQGIYVALPAMASWLGEEPFAKFSLLWDRDWLRGEVEVDKPFTTCVFSDYAKGDCVELFIDTRDNKKAAIPSRFCHRFILFPGDIEGGESQEITRFIADQERPLCDPEEIRVDVTYEKKKYILRFSLPAQGLYGYHPDEFPRVGFAYQIHRYEGTPQSFPCSAKMFPLWQHPHLWASFTMQTTGKNL